MIQYYLTHDKALCCGCRACELVCPKGAITMAADEEGFLYPTLDSARCVTCGLCSRVCPVEHRPQGNGIQNVFAVQHRDEEILKASSSGGVFRLVADRILEDGGCVVGCRWEEGNRPVLAVAEKIDQLQAMQGSKYLFSDTRDMFQQVKQRLERGQTVLFTGAPCQCAGLLNYLGHGHENLITADFLCHGMPSQQMFDAYVSALEKRCGARVYDICFRDKELWGWGRTFSFRYRKGGAEKKVCHVGWGDPYQYGFARGYFNRYSCYACRFRGEPRFSDLTICDYWGAERKHPSIPMEGGVSAVAINSEKGARLWGATMTDAVYEETTREDVAQANRTLLHKGGEEIPPLRREIYQLVRTEGWQTVARKHLRPRGLVLKKLWYRLPRGLTARIKRIIR